MIIFHSLTRKMLIHFFHKIQCFSVNPKCSCMNDKYIRLYCTCFAFGVYCSDEYKCSQSCKNTSTNFQECQRERVIKISNIILDVLAKYENALKRIKLFYTTNIWKPYRFETKTWILLCNVYKIWNLHLLETV